MHGLLGIGVLHLGRFTPFTLRQNYLSLYEELRHGGRHGSLSTYQ
jgi:hypothetical protein